MIEGDEATLPVQWTLMIMHNAGCTEVEEDAGATGIELRPVHSPERA
jgi:hypothetical protein